MPCGKPRRICIRHLCDERSKLKSYRARSLSIKSSKSSNMTGIVSGPSPLNQTQRQISRLRRKTPSPQAKRSLRLSHTLGSSALALSRCKTTRATKNDQIPTCYRKPDRPYRRPTGTLHATIIRSPHAHVQITSVVFSNALPWSRMFRRIKWRANYWAS